MTGVCRRRTGWQVPQWVGHELYLVVVAVLDCGSTILEAGMQGHLMAQESRAMEQSKRSQPDCWGEGWTVDSSQLCIVFGSPTVRSTGRNHWKDLPPHSPHSALPGPLPSS